MGLYRQEYWSGVPVPSPGDLPDSGIEPQSSALQGDSLWSEPPAYVYVLMLICIFFPNNEHILPCVKGWQQRGWV